MSRKKPVRGINRRTTPKKNTIAKVQRDDGMEQRVRWCSTHMRWERN